MSENKFTPGPWKQVEYDDWLYVGGEEMEYIQYDPVDEPYNYAVENAVCVVGQEVELLETDYANAALITASPDLLAACEAAVKWFTKFHITHSLTFANAPELVEQLEAAIEKATNTS